MTPPSPPHHSPFRSLWSFTPGMGDEARQVLRDQLRRLLNAAVGQYSGQDSVEDAAPTSLDGSGDVHCVAEGVHKNSSAAGVCVEEAESPEPKDGVRRRRRQADRQDDGRENPKHSDGGQQLHQEDENSQQSENETRSQHLDDTCLQQQQLQVHCNDTSLEQQQEQLQVHYYQGLHDVASVLLMELGGEAAAFPLLSRLVVGHLRDCTRARCVHQYERGVAGIGCVLTLRKLCISLAAWLRSRFWSCCGCQSSS